MKYLILLFLLTACSEDTDQTPVTDTTFKGCMIDYYQANNFGRDGEVDADEFNEMVDACEVYK